ncbi:hypothetical protein AAVH_30275 [Aphelenchoides avenae]|nr:hypothetical protein AAVH_30275 [Aphelenchus avenae]
MPSDDWTFAALVRKYLGISAWKKAIFYLSFVTILSIVSDMFHMSEHCEYIKRSKPVDIYIGKLSWLWTGLLTCPFIYLTSRQRGLSSLICTILATRPFIASVVWFIVRKSIKRYEEAAGGWCCGASASEENECERLGGNWTPECDFGGHAMLLVFYLLVIAEEASRYEPSANLSAREPLLEEGTSTSTQEARQPASERFKSTSDVLYVFLFALHILWDVHLLLSCLFFHKLHAKLLGALAAVACWLITYRMAFAVVCFESKRPSDSCNETDEIQYVAVASYGSNEDTKFVEERVIV